jgi:RNA recognition motif-containing protein
LGEDADTADTSTGSGRLDRDGDSESESEESRGSRNALQNKRFERPKYSLYVGNVSWKASLEEVVGHIEQVIDKNTIKKIRWSHDKHTGEFRGFGHIDFYSEKDAVDSVPALSLLTIHERKLNVNVAIRKFAQGNDY